MKPLQYTLWRSKGALSIGFTPTKDKQVVFLSFFSRKDPKHDTATMALNLTEIGALVYSLTRHKRLSLVHDPQKGGRGAGAIIKTLKLTIMSKDQISIAMSISGKQHKFKTIKISNGEAVVICQLCNAAISHMLINSFLAHEQKSTSKLHQSKRY